MPLCRLGAALTPCLSLAAVGSLVPCGGIQLTLADEASALQGLRRHPMASLDDPGEVRASFALCA